MKKNNNIRKEETIKAIPIATQCGKEQIKVSYYTEKGTEIPKEFVGKTIVNVLSPEPKE